VTRTAVSLGAYAGALAVVFGAAFAAGDATDPGTTDRGTVAATDRGGHDTATSDEPRSGHSNGEAHGDADGDAHGDEPASAALPGLAVSEAGFTLTPAAAALPAGAGVPYRFTVTGPDGHPVTAYEVAHEKELHLIVVRRDLAGFQHVHPTRAADGTWTVPLDLRRAGTYRVFADFEPAGLGRGLTLGTDVAVAGRYRPAPLPAPAAIDTVAGYRVALAGAPVAGEETELTFTISADGGPETDLQPYLGAFGHLVSLRTGDLAYLHTHPAEDAHEGDVGGPRVRFATTFPTAGSYRLFLDFRIDGQVRTAEFTVEVGGHQ
jgi:hypothetical protein